MVVTPLRAHLPRPIPPSAAPLASPASPYPTAPAAARLRPAIAPLPAIHPAASARRPPPPAHRRHRCARTHLGTGARTPQRLSRRSVGAGGGRGLSSAATGPWPPSIAHRPARFLRRGPRVATARPRSGHLCSPAKAAAAAAAAAGPVQLGSGHLHFAARARCTASRHLPEPVKGVPTWGISTAPPASPAQTRPTC